MLVYARRICIGFNISVLEHIQLHVELVQNQLFIVDGLKQFSSHTVTGCTVH